MLLVLGMLALRVQAGPLALEVHASRTASLFHAVDQLSRWQPFSHEQYQRLLPSRTPDDERLLAAHAALRKKSGWGALDRALNSDESWPAALDAAVKAKQLSRADADEEARVLAHFSRVLGPFLDENEALTRAAAEGLARRKDELAAFAKRAARFCGVSALSLPLFVVASPTPGGGGGANGDVLVVEVSSGSDPFWVTLHESWHAMTRAHASELAAWRDFDQTTLGEAMAYAMSPGLYHEGTDDVLAQSVRNDLEKKDSFSDALPRFRRLGLAVRPLLAAALDDPRQNLSTFLPRVVDVMSAVRSLSGAIDAPARPGLFAIGPKLEGVVQRALASNRDVWWRPHGAAALAESRTHEVSLLVLVTTRDLPRLSPEERAIVGATVDSELAAGRTFELGRREGAREQVVLGAPDEAALARLAASSKELARLLK